MVSVKIKQEIPFQRIADLMVGAVECNSMTTQWCRGIELAQHTKELYDSATSPDPWYAVPALYGDPLLRIVLAVDDGDSVPRSAVITYETLEAAFQLMADKEPRHFADFMTENDDAVTADVFLQLAALGMVIYG